MISKCANPACAVPFLYLHEGRIFVIRPSSRSSSDISDAVMERYWLCAACAEILTLVQHEGGVALRRLSSSAKVRGRAPMAAGDKRRSAA